MIENAHQCRKCKYIWHCQKPIYCPRCGSHEYDSE